MPQHHSLDRTRRGLLAAGGAWAVFTALKPTTALAQAAGGGMRIGVIGSGHIGGTIGGLWVKAGHPVHVLVAPSRGTQGPGGADSGPLASAGTVAQAIAFGDALFIAVPYGALPQIGKDYGGALKGKVMLDACNAVAARDGAVADEVEQDGHRRHLAEVPVRHASGARVQHHVLHDLRARGQPARSEAGDPDRR